MATTGKSTNSIECFLYNLILVRRLIECVFLCYMKDEWKMLTHLNVCEFCMLLIKNYFKT